MSCTKWHQHSNRNDRDGDFKTLFLERPRAVGSNLTQHKPSLWICMRTKSSLAGWEVGGGGCFLLITPSLVSVCLCTLTFPLGLSAPCVSGRRRAAWRVPIWKGRTSGLWLGRSLSQVTPPRPLALSVCFPGGGGRSTPPPRDSFPPRLLQLHPRLLEKWHYRPKRQGGE